MSLEEVAKGATEECWEVVRGPAEEVVGWLQESGGPFLMGNEVSYGDFLLVSMLQFFKCVDEAVFGRVLAIDEAFGRVYEACGPWLERAD